MRTCLFGGSFDPVHTGHLAIAAAARDACGLDRVVFLPAARSPFKAEGSLLFGDEVRLSMLRAATAHLSWAEVSELDMRLPAPSWSWRVAEAWRSAHPDEQLYWLLGTDQWELLHLWARPDYLAELVTFIVYHRGSEPAPRPGVRAVFLPGPVHPASSSAIRAALLRGEEPPAGWLPPGVASLAGAALRSAAQSDHFA